MARPSRPGAGDRPSSGEFRQSLPQGRDGAVHLRDALVDVVVGDLATGLLKAILESQSGDLPGKGHALGAGNPELLGLGLMAGKPCAEDGQAEVLSFGEAEARESSGSSTAFGEIAPWVSLDPE